MANAENYATEVSKTRQATGSTLASHYGVHIETVPK
jgi:hypothetical protein